VPPPGTDVPHEVEEVAYHVAPGAARPEAGLFDEVIHHLKRAADQAAVWRDTE
jgi:hypothetical protein